MTLQKSRKVSFQLNTINTYLESQVKIEKRKIKSYFVLKKKHKQNLNVNMGIIEKTERWSVFSYTFSSNNNNLTVDILGNMESYHSYIIVLTLPLTTNYCQTSEWLHKYKSAARVATKITVSGKWQLHFERCIPFHHNEALLQNLILSIFPITSFANAVHFWWMYDRRKVNDRMILFLKKAPAHLPNMQHD